MDLILAHSLFFQILTDPIQLPQLSPSSWFCSTTTNSFTWCVMWLSSLLMSCTNQPNRLSRSLSQIGATPSSSTYGFNIKNLGIGCSEFTTRTLSNYLASFLSLLINYTRNHLVTILHLPKNEELQQQRDNASSIRDASGATFLCLVCFSVSIAETCLASETNRWERQEKAIFVPQTCDL